jgi:hypothetical protein
LQKIQNYLRSPTHWPKLFAKIPERTAKLCITRDSNTLYIKQERFLSNDQKPDEE